MWKISNYENSTIKIILSGGSISHHHGIGKTKMKWYKKSVSDVGVKMFKSIKNELDPNNVFAIGNILSNDDLNISSKL